MLKHKHARIHQIVHGNEKQRKPKKNQETFVRLCSIWFFFFLFSVCVSVVLKTFQTLITICFVYSYLLKVTNWMQCVHFNCSARSQQLRRLLDYSLDALISSCLCPVLLLSVFPVFASFKFTALLIYFVVVFSYYCWCCCWSFLLLSF